MKATSTSAERSPERPRVIRDDKPWLLRWWPALVPATLSAFCVVVLAVQQSEIRNLQQEIEKLSATLRAPEPEPGAVREQRSPAPQSSRDEAELEQLRQTATQLTQEVEQLETVRAANNALRAELAKPPTGPFAAEEMAAVQEARENAARIVCVNNMKQIALAAHIWAAGHGDVFPSDVVSMSKELNNPKILVCPGDTARQPAARWEDFTMANCSYQLLATPPGPAVEPDRVLTRCAIHDNVGLYDGSVHSRVSPERLVARDGKLYLTNESGSKAAPVSQ